MAKRITKEQEQEIINLYLSGKTSKEVSEIVNVGSTSVLRVLQRNNIPTRAKSEHKTPNKFSEDKEQEIIRLYTEENKNTNEIAKLYNTYNTSIRRVLERNNIPIRSYGVAQRKVNLEDIKSKEGTSDFDYFLGLLATDGYITNNRVVLDFSEENKELLDYWNEFLGNKCNITVSIHKVFKVPQYRIAFRNEEVCKYLETFGITPNKTFNLTLKYINWDVIRGIIDGDGCVSSSNQGSTIRISITSGCKKFLEQIQQFYIKHGITSYLHESDRNINPTYDLYVYNTNDIIKIYNNLYSNAHFFLKRKEMKFGPLLRKLNMESLVNSGKENATPIPSQVLKEKGVETLNEVPKS